METNETTNDQTSINDYPTVRQEFVQFLFEIYFKEHISSDPLETLNGKYKQENVQLQWCAFEKGFRSAERCVWRYDTAPDGVFVEAGK